MGVVVGYVEDLGGRSLGERGVVVVVGCSRSGRRSRRSTEFGVGGDEELVE